MFSYSSQGSSSKLLLIRINQASDILLDFRAGSIDRMVKCLSQVIEQSGRQPDESYEVNRTIRKMALLEKERRELIAEFMRVVFR